MKTIKQIADEIGVTKQAIFYHIKKEPLSKALHPFTQKLDGVLMVDFDGENLIKSQFNINQHENFDVKENQSFDSDFDGEVVQLLQDTISVLKDQLFVKDSQIEKKDQQIEVLQQSLNDTIKALLESQQTAQAAQALHAGTMQQLADGAEQFDEPKVISVNVEAEIEQMTPIVSETLDSNDLKPKVNTLPDNVQKVSRPRPGAATPKRKKKRSIFDFFSR